ncbi:MAG TPA: type II toxin-antitoxin system PrlF family antitoxin [Stellaceae bacterium]|nr:type II toxin-antitoxin system PrlF family antitoxin [Stellaceae bacterium]
MIASKITSKAQTTIPRAVRAALRLGVGDTILYAIDGDHVVLTRAVTPDAQSGGSIYEEWGSETDRHAYAKL